MTAPEFISQFSAIVVRSCIFTGLFPSVYMAQAGLETGWGASLPKNSNNYFGIKADSGWKGPKVLAWTTENINGQNVQLQDYFRVYKSAGDSFKDRVNFLKENANYKKAGVFTAKTPLEQIKALKKAGYATDPYYVQKITTIMNQYNLYSLDAKRNAWEMAIVAAGAGSVLAIGSSFLINHL